MIVEGTLKRALASQQAGRINEALQLYSAVLAIDPGEVNALHLSGCCRLQLGQAAQALEQFDATIKLAPGFATAHSNRAVALRRLGRIPEALTCVDHALRLQPNLFDAHCNRSAILIDLQRPAEALGSADRAIAIRPGDAQSHNNRGEALRRMKRYEEAIACYDAALRGRPDFGDAYFNRALALIELGRFEPALHSVESALAIQPGSAEMHYQRGQVLWKLNRLDEAVRALDAAIGLQPDFVKAHGFRAELVSELGCFDEALSSCERAIELQPDQADLHGNRANILFSLGRVEESLASYDKALALDPKIAVTGYAGRGIVFAHGKRFVEAIADLEKVVELDPEQPWVRGHLLYYRMQCCLWQGMDDHLHEVFARVERDLPVANPFTLLATPASPGQLLRSAQICNHNRYPASGRALWNGERYHHEKIRIGYLSADFHNHATAHLMAELFEQHDRQRFEIIAFSFGPPVRDVWRERLVKAFDQFHEVSGQTDGGIARLVREQEIDIAIDLKGYTQDSRTRIFAYRPAPIQVNFLGYPGTLGAPYIDYLIADPVLIPIESRRFYTEKIAYLPDSYQPNDSKKIISDMPVTRREQGLPEQAFVFCCFNNSFKITPDVFNIWMRLLKKVEGSVLWLLEGNAEATNNLRAEADRRGVAPERLIFASRMDLDQHLARHRLADLFLDTLYYNAHTTTSDALWAGLPVLTCPGEAFASRVAASLLTAMEMPELIVRDREEYETLAFDLAADPIRLAKLRQRLQAKRDTAPLFDAPRYARNIESLYLAMHARWLDGLAADHIELGTSAAQGHE